MAENLAAKLYLLLGNESVKAEQWKLLGQERDGSLLVGWIEENTTEGEKPNSNSVVGHYDRAKEKLQILQRFDKVLNIVQATVNQNHTLLGYVVKQEAKASENGSQSETSDESSDILNEGGSMENGERGATLNPRAEAYSTYMAEIRSTKVHSLDTERTKQIRVQFLYKQKEQKNGDRFLVLIHQECVMMYTAIFDENEEASKLVSFHSESLVQTFIWAQWDASNQVLYHIHNRRAPTSLVTEDDNESRAKTNVTSPTLSGLQFHDDLPHETVVNSVLIEDSNKKFCLLGQTSKFYVKLSFPVNLSEVTVECVYLRPTSIIHISEMLNIPLNLPQLPSTGNCGTYEDDVIPLRVHDCSLDLIVISDWKGMVCVCHHYLYRPVQPPQHVLESSLSESNTVHFAYSVTLLHHSCVIHCVVPGIPWSQAKLMRPTFAISGDYMVVLVQGSFTHMLEIGVNHDPCCHMLCGPLASVPSRSSYLVPLLDLTGSSQRQTSGSRKSEIHGKSREPSAEGANTAATQHDLVSSIPSIDLPTLDLVTILLTNEFLIDVFRRETTLQLRMGIIHYFLCHRNDLEIVACLVALIAEKPRSLDVVRFMQEILVGGSYALVQKNLLPDAVPLLSLLPITMLEEYVGYDAKINDLTITLSHEKLWNTSVMLLSPQQRLVPYRSDLWTRLWDNLGKRSENRPRFKPSQIAEKLLVSLACYQPEALSRSSTPMSPSGGLVLASASFGDLMSNRSNKILGDSALPFVEVESCTASKQEHIVSVNLRELSMYLLKHGTQTPPSSYVSCTPLQVHAMATRHVAAQLESSRSLCQMICKAANVDPRMEPERGFILIDQLDETRRNLLFMLLERYRYAIENSAFPMPQGFTSFFTYLGYRSLRYPMFLQYVERSVFELQVDVTKIIIADIGDTKENAIRKLQLLSLLPRSRAKRLLNQWLHPVSFMIRAREHATNILSGEVCQNRGRTLQHCNRHNGLAAFPSADRLSPLDTFLDLLTAKASLNELDFGLLIEATVTSTEDFL